MPDGSPTVPAHLDAAWTDLARAADAARATRIERMFAIEPGRLGQLTLDAAGLTLDLSKQAWTHEGVDSGLNLARAAGVEAARARMFAGAEINSSEGRPVLHAALRSADGVGLTDQGALV